MAEIWNIQADDARSAFAGSACAFGVFDGVHRGHRHLIGHAQDEARRLDGASVVLTFSVDPDELFAGRQLVKLMTNEQRIEALGATGVDIVAVLPFDKEFASLSPSRFLDWAFSFTPPSSLHVGEGFRFGSKAAGTADDLRAWGEPRGMCVTEHELLRFEGAPVSSTRVRKLLGIGRRDQAEHVLGHALATA